MLRRNILLDMGEEIPRYKTFLELPDDLKAINVVCKIVNVAPGCKKFSSRDVGRQVVMGLIRDLDARINPERAEKMGLKRHWYFIAHEDKLKCFLDK